jgi:hypothetical protein
MSTLAHKREPDLKPRPKPNTLGHLPAKVHTEGQRGASPARSWAAEAAAAASRPAANIRGMSRQRSQPPRCQAQACSKHHQSLETVELLRQGDQEGLGESFALEDSKISAQLSSKPATVDLCSIRKRRHRVSLEICPNVVHMRGRKKKFCRQCHCRYLPFFLLPRPTRAPSLYVPQMALSAA